MRKILSLLCFITSFSVFAQSFDSAKLDAYLANLETHNKAMLSIAVVENSMPVYQQSIGFADVESGQKANKDTQYRIGSITKVFTATMIFQLIEEGKLTLDTSLATFFPDVKNAGDITISMLLNHRSGIHNLTNTPAYQTYMTAPKTRDAMMAIIEELGSDFAPNSRAQYSNTGYVLLGYIIEEISGQSYARQLQQRISDVLDLNNTGYGAAIDIRRNQANSYTYDTTAWSAASVTDMSIPHGAGAIISTPTDVATFLSGLFNGKLVSAASLAKMKEINDGYGRGLFKFPFHASSAYGHNGGIDGFRSQAGYFESENVAFAITANGLNYALKDITLNDISIAILSIYYGMPFELPDYTKTAIELPADELGNYEGVFASDTVPLKITLSVVNGQLTAQATGQSALKLTAFSRQEFRFEPAGIVILFEKEGDTVDFNAFQLQQGGGKYAFTRE